MAVGISEQVRSCLSQKYGPFEKQIFCSVEALDILNQFMMSFTVLYVSLPPPALFGEGLSQKTRPTHEACILRTR